MQSRTNCWREWTQSRYRGDSVREVKTFSSKKSKFSRDKDKTSDSRKDRFSKDRKSKFKTGSKFSKSKNFKTKKFNKKNRFKSKNKKR